MSDIRWERCPEEPARWHPYADIFPWIEGAAFDDFVEDIRKNGVIEPIVKCEGMILDGRNRYMAARHLGIEYPFTDYEGDDPLGFVIAKNLARRHLTESQRAMVAAKLAKLPVGRPEKGTIGPISAERAGQQLNVSEKSVDRARAVQDRGAPELVTAVEAGKVSVSAASDIATLPKEQQAEIVARGEREILQAAKEIRAGKAVVRRAERLERIAEISKGNSDLATDTRYPIIYADPPWKYENPPIGASNRSIENHYPTMTLEEICALPVGDLATEDAILYLWATAPKLAECMKVIEAWGFEYRTNLVWDKEVIGMGYHARNQHELLLVAKRGEFPPPAPGTQPASVHRERRGAHSAKPQFYYEMIEAAYPGIPKIELFSRSARDGWSAWGNQAEAA